MAKSAGEFHLSARAKPFVAYVMVRQLSLCEREMAMLQGGVTRDNISEMAVTLVGELNRKYIGLRHIRVATFAALLAVGYETSSITKFINGISKKHESADSFLDDTLAQYLETNFTGKIIRTPWPPAFLASSRRLAIPIIGLRGRCTSF